MVRAQKLKSRSFRSAPARLKRMRYGVRHVEYARFYGLYVNRVGKRKRFSFAVRVDLRMSNREIHKNIAIVCNAINYDWTMPGHRLGHFFHSFHELLNETPWFKVRRIVRYKAGAHYVR